MRLTDLVTELLLLLGALVLVALLLKGFGPKPLYVRRRFLTDNEARVLALLEMALPRHRIMAQVAMGALIKAGETDLRRAQGTRNRFAQKIVDFAVVTRDDYAEVIAIVELDDRTHNSSRDRKRDAMTLAAGYRTIRIPSRPRPSAESVCAAVADLRQLHSAAAALPPARR
jgi:hypothetical protein